MTETPTEETAAKAKGGGAYLPKLPEGWAYSLALVGPDKQRIDVTPDRNSMVDGGYEMEVETGTGTLPPVKADSLSEAARMGVKAVKALAVVRTHRAAAAAAEEQFRAAIGRPSPEREDGTLATPASLDDAKGRVEFKPGGAQIQTNAEASDA